MAPGIRALEMERAMCIGLIGQMRDSVDVAADFATGWGGLAGAAATGAPQSLDDVAEKVGEGAKSIALRGIYIPVWQFAWSHDDEKNYLEETQILLEGARESQAARSLHPATAAAQELSQRDLKQGPYSRARHFASGMLTGSLTNYFQRVAIAQTQRELVCAAIALRRFELRHGKLPAVLDQLVPEFLPQLPRDFFDGQSLRYRLRDDGGFLLYSVGKDQKDDGGDPGPDGARGSVLQYYNGRDIVWPIPGAPEEVEADAEKVRRKK